MSEFHLYATFTARPGQDMRILDAIAEYGQLVCEKEGTVEFRAYTLRGAPQSFHVHQIYVDEAAFQAYVTSDLSKQFNAVLTDLIVEPSSVVTFLRPVSAPVGPPWHTTKNHIVEKPWGREEVFAGELEPYVGKIITLFDGNAVSLQRHARKTETLTLLSGRLVVLG